MIRYAMMSVAKTCIIPMQDYLELDDSARMNEPGTTGKNWKWRMKKDTTAQYEQLASRIKTLVNRYGR